MLNHIRYHLANALISAHDAVRCTPPTTSLRDEVTQSLRDSVTKARSALAAGLVVTGVAVLKASAKLEPKSLGDEVA